MCKEEEEEEEYFKHFVGVRHVVIMSATMLCSNISSRDGCMSFDDVKRL